MFELTVLYILYTGLPFLNAIYSNCACFLKVKLYQFYSETDVSWADEKEIKKERKETYIQNTRGGIVGMASHNIK